MFVHMCQRWKQTACEILPSALMNKAVFFFLNLLNLYPGSIMLVRSWTCSCFQVQWGSSILLYWAPFNNVPIMLKRLTAHRQGKRCLWNGNSETNHRETRMIPKRLTTSVHPRKRSKVWHIFSVWHLYNVNNTDRGLSYLRRWGHQRLETSWNVRRTLSTLKNEKLSLLNN